MATNQDPTNDKNELPGLLGKVLDLLKQLLESLNGPGKEDSQPGKSNT